MKIEAPQMAQMARGLFFARVAAVVRDRTPHDGLRAATLDTPLRDALWTPHWDWIAGQPEGSAALFMAFLLGCSVLGADTQRGAQLALQARDRDASMQNFLATHGLLAPEAIASAGFASTPVSTSAQATPADPTPA